MNHFCILYFEPYEIFKNRKMRFCFAVGVPTSPTSLTVNNLLLGKSAIVSSRGRRLGPPPGAIPPSRQTPSSDKVETQIHEHPDETISWNEEKTRKKLSRRNSVKWKDLKKDKTLDRKRKTSIDLEERGDGIIVSEIEANEMIASIRSRSSSESSTYSSHTASSTDTSLCDENERPSEEEQDLSDDEKEKQIKTLKSDEFLRSPILRDTKITYSSSIKETEPKHSSDFNKYISTTTNMPIKSISDYLDSEAGEPLRTYIDGFESKLKDNLTVNLNRDPYRPSSVSPRLIRNSSEKDKVLQRLNRAKVKEDNKITESMCPTGIQQTHKTLTDLSPIKLSPCDYHKSSYKHNFTSTFISSNTKQNTEIRPPDIIDSFIMYPNFVPDIDLLETNISDSESSAKSPGGDSIIVSEDEPPIPLKIDKYFEHSPEFFGARVTDPNSSEIPNRRSIKRLSRQPKKPESLTLQSNQHDKPVQENSDRASSLPQNHNFTTTKYSENSDVFMDTKQDPYQSAKQTPVSPKDYVLRTGRNNSERALQIILENSKILSRILTKQTLTDINSTVKDSYVKTAENVSTKHKSFAPIPERKVENKLSDSSPLLKESTSDSFIGNKLILRNGSEEKKKILRVRPISVDDPFSLDSRSMLLKKYDCNNLQHQNSDSLGNKTDSYGWENKGFLAKRNLEKQVDNSEKAYNDNNRKQTNYISVHTEFSSELTPISTVEWRKNSFSEESKSTHSSQIKDASTYDRHCTSDDYNYPFSTKYSDFVTSKAGDLLYSQNVDQISRNFEAVPKTEDSQASDFTSVVTSSISFTYEPSIDDDSTGAKSNSSDTLCQITSLDQVSTPISPKYFPSREFPVIAKENTDKSDKIKVESDDTCSTITSLIETDTLSSLSYPRSPSTGSYHPFPARPVMRVPKEIGVRLGMYSKDILNSPSK